MRTIKDILEGLFDDDITPYAGYPLLAALDELKFKNDSVSITPQIYREYRMMLFGHTKDYGKICNDKVLPPKTWIISYNQWTESDPDIRIVYFEKYTESPTPSRGLAYVSSGYVANCKVIVISKKEITIRFKESSYESKNKFKTYIVADEFVSLCLDEFWKKNSKNK